VAIASTHSPVLASGALVAMSASVMMPVSF
jgi:hypothetical protein